MFKFYFCFQTIDLYEIKYNHNFNLSKTKTDLLC